MPLIDETPESLEKKVKEQKRSVDALEISKPKSVVYTDHDDPFVTVDGGDKPAHIYSLSPLAWVPCGDNIYVLELLKKGYIRIEADGRRNS
jgi:ATP-dependent helicase IRC3